MEEDWSGVTLECMGKLTCQSMLMQKKAYHKAASTISIISAGMHAMHLLTSTSCRRRKTGTTLVKVQVTTLEVVTLDDKENSKLDKHHGVMYLGEWPYQLQGVRAS